MGCDICGRDLPIEGVYAVVGAPVSLGHCEECADIGAQSPNVLEMHIKLGALSPDGKLSEDDPDRNWLLFQPVYVNGEYVAVHEWLKGRDRGGEASGPDAS